MDSSQPLARRSPSLPARMLPGKLLLVEGLQTLESHMTLGSELPQFRIRPRLTANEAAFVSA